MTISATLKKFETLKNAILADGKVDYNEATVLLDFIAPYARSGNRNFVQLYRLLIKSREDGKITEEESNALVSEIENAEVFLKREKKIETWLVWIAGIALLFGIAYALI